MMKENSQEGSKFDWGNLISQGISTFVQNQKVASDSDISKASVDMETEQKRN